MVIKNALDYDLVYQIKLYCVGLEKEKRRISQKFIDESNRKKSIFDSEGGRTNRLKSIAATWQQNASYNDQENTEVKYTANPNFNQGKGTGADGKST